MLIYKNIANFDEKMYNINMNYKYFIKRGEWSVDEK
jgi:hypothetical protein